MKLFDPLGFAVSAFTVTVAAQSLEGAVSNLPSIGDGQREVPSSIKIFGAADVTPIDDIVAQGGPDAGGACIDPSFVYGCRYLPADNICHNLQEFDYRLRQSISSFFVYGGYRCHISIFRDCPQITSQRGKAIGPVRVGQLSLEWNDKIQSFRCSRGSVKRLDEPSATPIREVEAAEPGTPGDNHPVDDEIMTVFHYHGDPQAALESLQESHPDMSISGVLFSDHKFKGNPVLLVSDGACHNLHEEAPRVDKTGSSMAIRKGTWCFFVSELGCGKSVVDTGPIAGPFDYPVMTGSWNDVFRSYKCFIYNPSTLTTTVVPTPKTTSS